MSGPVIAAAPSDCDLVRAAQAGDVAALGLLLATHRAGMYAVALALMGHGVDAEDAVQDAALIALRRIGDVREPAAAGPWLRTVVRNVCRARLRRISAVPVPDVGQLVAARRMDGPPDPAEVLERHVLGDWVWTALEELSPALKLVTLLRYFTDVTSYEEIAALCGVPVGTVRSRLNQARKKLALALLDADDGPLDDVRAFAAFHCGLAEETMAFGGSGPGTGLLSGWWSQTARVTTRKRKSADIRYLADGLVRDSDDGVHQDVSNVVASRDVVIWEIAVHSPPESPLHCPPSAVWVHHVDGGRAGRVRLYHPRERATGGQRG